MTRFRDFIFEDPKAPGRRRRLLAEILRPRRWRQLIHLASFYVRTGNRWRRSDASPGLELRRYSSYRQYLAHQAGKLQHLELSDYEAGFLRSLKERLEAARLLKPGSNALCLGARRGAEVRGRGARHRRR